MAEEPRAGSQKKRSHATRNKEPNRSTNSVRRKPNWWNKTSNTNKILIFIGGGSIIVTVFAAWLNVQQHREEHRPRMIFSRAPELLEPLTCDMKTGESRTGKMRLWIKNIGNNQANEVYFYMNSKLVPDKKTGDKITDSIPPVTQETCQLRIRTGAGFLPIAPGVEHAVEIRQAITAAPGLIGSQSTVQYYGAAWIHYLDESGGNHGTCNTYRLTLPNGEFSFACGQPITGSFLQTVTGHCAN